MRLGVNILILFSIISLFAQEHPSLILTVEGVRTIRTHLGKVPLFDQTLAQVRKQIDAEIQSKIDVPIPKDLAGGYTHERHKANFFAMKKAGVLYQITLEEKYAMYVLNMLLKYAEIYPTLGKHPAKRSYARGKFFWQCLNDANWLVYTSQAYDCIYEWIDNKTKKKLNKELFRPYAEYISVENPQFFNRIHNHSTWGNAAVGMIGLVMDDQELVTWALEGLDQKILSDTIKDNDGGSIQLKGQKKAGFLAQLDHAFSPDGYYTEGPYYQRYAMYPFLMFAQGLANKKPELGILNYRDTLLLKAVYALINQTNAVGEFFPINDAQKGMSLSSRELVNAISMAYHYGRKDPELLSLIRNQGRVPLNDSGLSAAKGIEKGKAKPYHFKSLYLTDGAKGNKGAIGMLRSKDLTLVMKYAKHGMGHGHFDRLGFLLFDGEKEVFQDYGSARWVNIEHKDGGGYLKENQTWAKQTVAHNSIVINHQSQFGADVQKAEGSSGIYHFFDASDADVQVMSAAEPNAYLNWNMFRTMALLNLPELENPIVLDLLSLINVQNETQIATLELPLYYKGELMSTNVKIETQDTLIPMGDTFGYQHLWMEAKAKLPYENYKMTWFHTNKFYSMTMVVNKNDEAFFTRIGANDPNFNLRRDPGIIINRKSGNTLFAQIYEAHGSYSTSSEIPINSFSSIESIKVLHHSKYYNAVEIILKTGNKYIFCNTKKIKKKEEKHILKINQEEIEWIGNYRLLKI